MRAAFATRLPTVDGRRIRQAIILCALFCASAIPLFLAMRYRLGTELADDGAFFLRYAENMAAGHFWVWNIGQAPIWGASAPLYPLLVALPIAAGVGPTHAAIGVGLVISVVTLSGVSVMLGRRFGVMAGVSFVVFAALDTELMYYSGAGLETPLTIALLAIAIWTLLHPTPEWVIGLVAGVLMVNKVDLIPIGLLLLAAHGLSLRRVPRRALAVAVIIALAWYVFAWIYFGAPLPNSFLTKALHQGAFHQIIGWKWFGDLVLFAGVHKWLLAFAAIAAWHGIRTRSPLVIFLGGVVLIHLAIYTLKYPFEPYDWYAMPSVFCLLVGAAIGVALATRWLKDQLPRWPQVGYGVAIGVVVLVLVASVGPEQDATAALKQWTSLIEHDRADAGRWVAQNTPKSFTLLTNYGNPAVYSQRTVIDGSFLNMKYESGNLVTRFHPDVIIQVGLSGSTPTKPLGVNIPGYRIVRVFDRSYSAVGSEDFCFVVLARDDVVGQITNVESQ